MSCCRISGPLSIKIRVVSVSIIAAERSRLSCLSVLLHTAHAQPKEGTPPDVPVPRNVNFISPKLSLSNVYFGMNCYTEAVVYILLYLMAELYNVFTRGPAAVYEHKSLLIVHTCSS